MAITTNNSIKVNARRCLMTISLVLENGPR